MRGKQTKRIKTIKQISATDKRDSLSFWERLFFRRFVSGWKNIEKSLKKVLTEEDSSVKISFVAETTATNEKESK